MNINARSLLDELCSVCKIWGPSYGMPKPDQILIHCKPALTNALATSLEDQPVACLRPPLTPTPRRAAPLGNNKIGTKTVPKSR